MKKLNAKIEQFITLRFELPTRIWQQGKPSEGLDSWKLEVPLDDALNVASTLQELAELIRVEYAKPR